MPPSDVPRFDAVTLDCPDPVALARFYADLFAQPVPEGDGPYVTLESPSGAISLTFARVENFVAPTWPDPAVPQQMHLDFYVEDPDAAHERAVALGARHLDTQPNFRVYADPVGHLFCLCSW